MARLCKLLVRARTSALLERPAHTPTMAQARRTNAAHKRAHAHALAQACGFVLCACTRALMRTHARSRTHTPSHA
eukprot:6105323-Pleurochrysis_carterae.AAC.1